MQKTPSITWEMKSHMGRVRCSHVMGALLGSGPGKAPVDAALKQEKVAR